ncbi:MAG: hypothetical protein HC845_13645 [Akkermansiaceae bacterium]|nr:hypothetical protein [Akkermansiaceae bacterium]
MSRHAQDFEEDWENDMVWQLLDQAPPIPASQLFADKVVRAARLEVPAKTWWQRFLSPVPMAGLASAVAAIAILFAFTFAMVPNVDLTMEIGNDSLLVNTVKIGAMQNAAETEAMLAVADSLDHFSDAELVKVVGF